MQQYLTASIPVPPEYVLIEKEMFDDLVKRADASTEVWWGMPDLMKAFKTSTPGTVKDILTYPPFERELKGIVYQPRTNGEPWSAAARPLRQWIEENHNRIKETRHLWQGRDDK